MDVCIAKCKIFILVIVSCMFIKRVIRKSFEFVAGLASVSSGEPYSVGKETASYMTDMLSTKIYDRKERKRREKLYRH